jgi:FOG: GAF domain
LTNKTGSRSRRPPRDQKARPPARSQSGRLGTSLASVRKLSKPFDLEKAKGDFAESLRRISSSQFRTGGNRVCTPLWTGDRCIGVVILADRVGGVPYTVEELDLLKCMGDQIAVGLLNLRLTEEVMRAKELEAFQAISAFFIHDLKNAASTLSLTLQNLPVHFDDPIFDKTLCAGSARQQIASTSLSAALALATSRTQTGGSGPQSACCRRARSLKRRAGNKRGAEASPAAKT